MSADRETVQNLLKALEEQATSALALTHPAKSSAARTAFSAYMDFRQRVTEFEMFSMVIQHRISNLGPTANQDDLQEQLDRLNIAILSHLIGANIEFFEAMADGDLPIGSRDVFVSELKTLHQAQQQLANSRYQGHLNEQAQRNLRRAEKILREIIEKAPGLLDLAGEAA